MSEEVKRETDAEFLKRMGEWRYRPSIGFGAFHVDDFRRLLQLASPTATEAQVEAVAEAICQARYEMPLRANGGAVMREFIKEAKAALSAMGQAGRE